MSAVTNVSLFAMRTAQSDTLITFVFRDQALRGCRATASNEVLSDWRDLRDMLRQSLEASRVWTRLGNGRTLP